MPLPAQEFEWNSKLRWPGKFIKHYYKYLLFRKGISVRNRLVLLMIRSSIQENALSSEALSCKKTNFKWNLHMLSAVILLKTHTFKGNVVRCTSMSRFMADFISILVYYFVRNIDPFYRFFYEALYSRLDISCTQAIFFSLEVISRLFSHLPYSLSCSNIAFSPSPPLHELLENTHPPTASSLQHHDWSEENSFKSFI